MRITTAITGEILAADLAIANAARRVNDDDARLDADDVDVDVDAGRHAISVALLAASWPHGSSCF